MFCAPGVGLGMCMSMHRIRWVLALCGNAISYCVSIDHPVGAVAPFYAGIGYSESSHGNVYTNQGFLSNSSEGPAHP